MPHKKNFKLLLIPKEPDLEGNMRKHNIVEHLRKHKNFSGEGEVPLEWHPTPVLLPGKSHGWRSLVGCSPWGREESDMTERLHFHFSLLCIGEGNGNPLQCSYLENLRDGVAQSLTQLK